MPAHFTDIYTHYMYQPGDIIILYIYTRSAHGINSSTVVTGFQYYNGLDKGFLPVTG